MRISICLLFFLQIHFLLNAQQNSNDILREKFYFEVIQIEEFIERFNFEEDNKLVVYLRTQNPDMDITRRKTISSLFNTIDTTFNAPLANTFINFVDDTLNPHFLDFYDNSWYAEVNCVFKIQNAIDTGQLILMNQHKEDLSSKWVIAGVKSKLLEMPASKDTLRILSPVSHGTDFIALYDIFKDGDNIQNYIARDFKIDTLTYFIALLNLSKIELKELLDVRYHFLQIPKWIFTVDYYNRKELNSGWLISKLQRVSIEEKENYKAQILRIEEN